MHAVKLITPGILFTMAFGLLVFIIIFRTVFTKKK
jgi:UPF0716 family protein affecting phage T7 exclusion